MKTLAFLSFILIAVNSSSMWSPVKEKPRLRIPEFYVRSSTVDPELDENHARFELQFTIPPNLEYKVSQPKIELSCNGVIRSFTLDSSYTYTIDVAPGDYTFVLSAGTAYYEIFSPKVAIEGKMKTIVQCTFSRVQQPTRIVTYKPVIYTYADEETPVSLDLEPIGKFTFTYPEYVGNWQGTANPDGSFTTNGKSYPYLFWEGQSDHLAQLQDFSEGFIIEKENVIAFLEEQLMQIGFNDQERTDFITFWGPRMTQSDRGIARFLVNDAYDQLVAGLTVSPKPDHQYRLYLLWTPIDASYNEPIQPQQLSRLERGGLTIVEWGGSEIPMLTQTASK